MDPWTIFLTVLVGALCVYWLSTRNYNYFKKLGIPHMKPVPLLGNMTEIMFRRKSVAIGVQDVYNCHPEARYVGFYSFTIPIIVLRDPELIKSIAIRNFDSFPNHRMFAESPNEPLFDKNLFALKDDEWRNMRVLLSPAFTSSKMKMMFKTMSQCAIDFADSLAEQKPLPEELDMKDTFGRYTIDVIASTAFGLSVNSMKDRDNEFYKLGKEAGDFGTWKMLKFFIISSCPWLAKLIKLKLFDPKTTDFFMNAIETSFISFTSEMQLAVNPKNSIGHKAEQKNVRHDS